MKCTFNIIKYSQKKMPRIVGSLSMTLFFGSLFAFQVRNGNRPFYEEPLAVVTFLLGIVSAAMIVDYVWQKKNLSQSYIELNKGKLCYTRQISGSKSADVYGNRVCWKSNIVQRMDGCKISHGELHIIGVIQVKHLSAELKLLSETTADHITIPLVFTNQEALLRELEKKSFGK